MLTAISPLTALQHAFDTGDRTPLDIARDVIERANGNASHNTYIRFVPEELTREAESLAARFPGSRPPLYGVPISLKDCFDLAGAQTTCGSRFYENFLAAATQHSTMAACLRNAGALITGKTHLHPLAYGITGQNPEYGDCVQPREASLLTGGSSSGAAASVQEGSALAAIGTDTGGSIRVPAALSGLVGYRAAHSLASPSFDLWAGAAHLAPSFDTAGFLLRDPRDAAPIAQALFGIRPQQKTSAHRMRIAFVADSFLGDCEADVLAAYSAWKEILHAQGAQLTLLSPADWDDTLEIFAGIQASEAAEIHRGHYEQFEATIRDRLHWGASLESGAVIALRSRLARFRKDLYARFENFDLLMLPAAPVSRLPANSDLSDARRIILRYTTPFSLGGLPALSMPGEMIGAPFGTGVQVAAGPGEDSILLAFASAVGERLAHQ